MTKNIYPIFIVESSPEESDVSGDSGDGEGEGDVSCPEVSGVSEDSGTGGVSCPELSGVIIEHPDKVYSSPLESHLVTSGVPRYPSEHVALILNP